MRKISVRLTNRTPNRIGLGKLLGICCPHGRDVILWDVPGGIPFRAFLKEKTETVTIISLLSDITQALGQLGSAGASPIFLTAGYVNLLFNSKRCPNHTRRGQAHCWRFCDFVQGRRQRKNVHSNQGIRTGKSFDFFDNRNWFCMEWRSLKAAFGALGS